MLDFDIIRDGGNVQRFHTTPTVKSQDVAQHSFNCALIIDSILTDFKPSISVSERHAAVMYMLLHDLPEQGIGDVPGPAKTGELGQALGVVEASWVTKNMDAYYADMFYKCGISADVAFLCKFVDNLECLLKCQEEVEMGNTKFKEKVNRIKIHLNGEIYFREDDILNGEQIAVLQNLMDKIGDDL
jgi:5'-deoxynucleotidase YfbR-like HD superfamily hydrolase